MKRIIFSICIVMTLFLMSPLMAAEKPVNDKGVFTLQLGAGLGPNTITWGAYSATYTSQGYYVIPPVIISGNFGIIDLVSAGFLLGYEGWGVNNSIIKYSINYFKIGVRSDFHFNRWIKVKRLDIYAGVVFGVNIINETGTLISFIPPYNATTAGFLWNVQAGARYYVAENFGFWGEVGYGYSIVSAGIIFKF